MKDEFRTDVRVCECHLVKALSEISDFPIRFDEDTKAYRLSARGREWPIPFCMFCGGQLPSDDYADCPRPDPDEEREATSIMVDVQSWNEALRLLGEPDEFYLYNFSSRDDDAIDLVLDSMHERVPEHWAPDPKGPKQQDDADHRIAAAQIIAPGIVLLRIIGVACGFARPERLGPLDAGSLPHPWPRDRLFVRVAHSDRLDRGFWRCPLWIWDQRTGK